MRYGWLIPGRVPICQTEVTWGREWVRVMAYQRRGQRQSGWWDFPKWIVNLSTSEKTITHSAHRHIQKKNLFLNRIHDKECNSIDNLVCLCPYDSFFKAKFNI